MSQAHAERTDIPGLLVVRLQLRHDEVGWIKDAWHRTTMTAAGLPEFAPVQHRLRQVAARGTTRGFHAVAWDQLIGLSHGRAFAAFVDLREGDGFGRTFSVTLDPGTSVFVPRGVAMADQVLEDGTTFGHLLSHHPTDGAPTAQVHPFDPALDIAWPLPAARAALSRRDDLLPLLSETTPMPPRRTLVVGTDTSLGRALLAEMPGAGGITESELASDDLDLSGWNTIINAYGAVASGWDRDPLRVEHWNEAAARAHRIAVLAQRHQLRLVHVSADPSFERHAPEHDEAADLDLRDPHAEALAAGELIATGVPGHLIIRTTWVMRATDGFLTELAAEARHHAPNEVTAATGRITFADELAAAITHLLDSAAPAGTYNVTGEGPVVSWADIARRVYLTLCADPALISESHTGPRQDQAALTLARLRGTGFRTGNSWLELDELMSAQAGRRARTSPAPAPAAGAPSRVPAPVAQAAAPAPDPTRPYRVLFVCTANICRSAYADVAARHLSPEGLHFSSAGTQALVDQPVDPPMAAHLAVPETGQQHRARQLTRHLVDEADLVLTMAADHRRHILDDWPTAAPKVYVIGHAARELAHLPTEVDLPGVTQHLWTHRSSDPGDQVPDPYRRGPERAAQAASQIDGYLDTITSTLSGLAQTGASTQPS
ncbi:dTDP-4-dehydrorhamnose 3,5-epimerase family protein [Parenemella sanctibonifatiensis]|nr:dTDP-4-dehydrorhamnose 3,5-epimerase family protein [Parenemella sanctibonifatiensis]